MPSTPTISSVGQVFTALSITTSEDTITFSFPTATNKGARAQVQYVSDVAWFYAKVTTGPYYRIPADVPFDLGPITHGQVVYVKGASAGTLYGIVKDAPIPSTRANS